MNRFFKFVSSIFSNTSDADLRKAETEHAIEVLRRAGHWPPIEDPELCYHTDVPVFHRGGVPRLEPGEVPVILKKGPQLPGKKRELKGHGRIV